MVYKAGTVHHVLDGTSDVHVVTAPQGALYSTAVMIATEYWDVTSQAWISLTPTSEEDADGNVPAQ